MTKYKCKFCNYKTEKSTRPEPCPYCSKKGGMMPEESARDILADA